MKFDIGFITPPLNKVKGGNILLKKFLNVIEPLSNELLVITGNYPEDEFYSSASKRIINISNNYRNGSLILKLTGYIFYQLKVILEIIKCPKKIRLFYIFLDGGALLLPSIVLKLTGRRVIKVVSHSAARVCKEQISGVWGLIIYRILCMIENLTSIIADKIVVYAPQIVKDFGLNRFVDKIFIGHRHYIDFDNFKILRDYNDREFTVGFIGRFSKEKGIDTFTEAVEKLFLLEHNIKVIIGGYGQYCNLVERVAAQYPGMLEYCGKVKYEDIPNILNRIKLLVIPSTTEGLPNIMIEAMACGTPVLVTPVGSVPDFIVDKKNGFILNSNSAQSIVSGIKEIFENQESLSVVSANGHALIKSDFTFEAAVDRFHSLMLSISS
ncbi:glycosyltransferase family 4 protein [Pelotomaculum propionicicum]|uniref:GDP-mannose-dependent monoacylated alpha-(1-6)-phosphatidylinositol monomannoside mannosyltransferase n=1 Tax=Pelotomaculum propionicicum TaxID=258475 RepID=A0A4Y7RPV8_9FIRM|nr:glycosyltransferase family 4 protein [Pelotomaculum propionicicum]NMB64003.1 glycosyltransferase family 4 protein [Spirochaetota bacterium]TEB11058.1 GDP-mannose-dependent monoacylated alpha-(1-6)-phosphatidylinositol monomannoside mannosyltransferase [Pelotomaculum propionicicum]